PKGRAIFWQRRIEWGKPAKFHLGSAQVMFWMRYGTLARSPEHRANPGEGRENHIYDKTVHEDLKGAVFIAEQLKEDAQQTIGKTENRPANQARSKQIPRRAKKAKHRQDKQKTKDSSGSQIALE